VISLRFAAQFDEYYSILYKKEGDMKLGFVSAIVPELSFEEVIDLAAAYGYSCVEICCWPLGKAERRYAGVTHIDVETLDGKKAGEIKNYCQTKGVEISALGYYPNPLDPDEEKSRFFISHIMKVIDASALLGVNRVTPLSAGTGSNLLRRILNFSGRYGQGLSGMPVIRGLK